MKKYIWASVILLIILIVIVLGYKNKKNNLEHSQVEIAATIFPIADIVQNIAGPTFVVDTIIPPGSSPHTFDITPSKRKQIEHAKIIFPIGYGIDDWTFEIFQSVKNINVCPINNEIDFMYDDHFFENENPHYWLSIESAKIISENIYNCLVEQYPALAADFQENKNSYINELKKAKDTIINNLSDIKTRDIITFHHAWAYYAREFDLNIIGAFEPFPGQEPSLQYIIDLQKIIKKHDIKVIFSEPQLSNETLEPFANDLGLSLYILDPIGDEKKNNSYIKMMINNSLILKQALSQ